MNRSTGTVQPRRQCARELPLASRAQRVWSVNSATFAAGVLAAAAFSSTAGAGIITEKAFFTNANPTVIDFESDGEGGEVSLIEGQSQSMPAAEYAAQGIIFDSPISWINDGNGDFDAAQFLGGSPTIAIPGSGADLIEITFTGTVRAFGMFVASNTAAGKPPVLTARDAQGAVLEMALFDATFIDGAVGNVDYGFMGVFSETPIASVEISKDAAIFDDIHISAVPGPGPIALFGLGALVAAGRRRR